MILSVVFFFVRLDYFLKFTIANLNPNILFLQKNGIIVVFGFVPINFGYCHLKQKVCFKVMQCLVVLPFGVLTRDAFYPIVSMLQFSSVTTGGAIVL